MRKICLINSDYYIVAINRLIFFGVNSSIQVIYNIMLLKRNNTGNKKLKVTEKGFFSDHILDHSDRASSVVKFKMHYIHIACYYFKIF